MTFENMDQSKPKLSKETFGQMVNWLRYHNNRKYSSSLLYGEMNTVHDLIRVFNDISKGKFDSSLEEWNRAQQRLNEMITRSKEGEFDDDTETIKPPNHPPMATDNHPPMNTNSPLSLITNCVFSGLPPESYTHWNDYFNEVSKSGVLYGLKISACGSMNSMLKLNGEDQ
jgi:hypothetical protein